MAGLLDPLRPFVEDGRYPGMAALVRRAGEDTVFDAIGRRDLSRELPFERGTILRLASMTKPITSAATMMLAEEGRLALDDPLARWLPEAAHLAVLRTPQSELDDVVPLDRPPTLFNLMTHTAGFAWGKGLDLPICHALDAATGTTPFVPYDADNLVARVCALPLICQPGSRWHYSNGSDLLGVVVARAGGQVLPEFLHDRIFGPLGMADTGFDVPAKDRDRFAVGYGRDGAGFAVHDDPLTGFWTSPPVFPAGGGGLVSTLDDYMAFARMLLAGGGGLLSGESVRLMTTSRLTPDQLRPLDPRVDFLRGQGFGLGLSVALSAKPGLRSAGSFSWPGGYGTTWFADPARDLVAVLATQVWQDHLTDLAPAFERAVYRAIGS